MPKCVNRWKKIFWHVNKTCWRSIQTNYWNGKKQWLHDKQFIGLWVLFKILFINCHKLSKQIELENPDLKQQIKFIGSLKRNEGATIIFIIEKSEETTSEFSQNAATVVWFWLRIKTEIQKIANLLGNDDSESSKFATRKWYVINDQNNTNYGERNEDGTTVKFETQVIKSNLCDYSDAYILVTGDITVTGGDANTRVAFKTCAPFTKCISHIND